MSNYPYHGGNTYHYDPNYYPPEGSAYPPQHSSPHPSQAYHPLHDPNRQHVEVYRDPNLSAPDPLSEHQQSWLVNRLFFSWYFRPMGEALEPRLVKVDASSVQPIENFDSKRAEDIQVEQLRNLQLIQMLDPTRLSSRYHHLDVYTVLAYQLVVNAPLFIDLDDITAIFRHRTYHWTGNADFRHYFLDAIRSIKLPAGVPDRDGLQNALYSLIGQPRTPSYTQGAMDFIQTHCREMYSVFCNQLDKYVKDVSRVQWLVQDGDILSSSSMEDYLYNHLHLAGKQQLRVEVRLNLEDVCARYQLAQPRWISQPSAATWADWLYADHAGRAFSNYLRVQGEKSKEQEEQRPQSRMSKIAKRFSGFGSSSRPK